METQQPSPLSPGQDRCNCCKDTTLVLRPLSDIVGWHCYGIVPYFSREQGVSGPLPGDGGERTLFRTDADVHDRREHIGLATGLAAPNGAAARLRRLDRLYRWW